MDTAPVLLSAQYRLAQHYLDKLRSAEQAFERGHASAIHGLRVFEKEQAHIYHWHAWAGKRSALDRHSAHLSIEFVLDGFRLLHIRQHPQELGENLKVALAAARQLGDVQAECKLLFYLFRALLAVGSLDEASACSQQLLSRADATRSRLFRGRALFAQGCVQEERGLYAEARQHYLNSLAIFEELRALEDISSVLNGLGSVELYLGNYPQAQAYFLRHLELAEASGQDSDICRALFAIAQAALTLEDIAGAKQYTERGVALCRTLNYKGMLCSGLLTLGACEIEVGELEAGCAYLEEGIQVAREIDSERNVIHGLSTLGYAQFRLGNYTQALDTLGEALELARQIGQPRFECNVLRNITNTHLMMGELAAAQAELREGLALAQSLDSDYQRAKTLCSAVLLWQRRGWHEQAAIWSGHLVDRSDIDQPVFQPVFAALEAALGPERYQQALERGKEKSLSEAMAEVQTAL